MLVLDLVAPLLRLAALQPEQAGSGVGRIVLGVGHLERRALVAEDAAEEKSRGNIAGFVVAESDPSGVGHILTIDVRPAAQRKHAGSLLLEGAESGLLQKNCKAILLETAVDNTAALSFYKHHGYAVIETIPRYYLDSVDALVMGKRLDVQAPAKVNKSKAKKT